MMAPAPAQQEALDELLRCAVWNLIFGGGSEEILSERIVELVRQGAVFSRDRDLAQCAPTAAAPTRRDLALDKSGASGAGEQDAGAAPFGWPGPSVALEVFTA